MANYPGTETQRHYCKYCNYVRIHTRPSLPNLYD